MQTRKELSVATYKMEYKGRYNEVRCRYIRPGVGLEALCAARRTLGGALSARAVSIIITCYVESNR